ncbi:lactose-binding lectin l-2-like isoform X2 [Hoplias malabaricus]|uniref:lactose-binding lectin l-2-like isoform X2 n=1 Tax=Hoplias malabaricus TaxID=27720 RepID=UPI0034626F52
MAHLMELLLLFVIFMVSATFDSFWDQLMKDSKQDKHSEQEYFIVQQSSCSLQCPSGWVTYGKRCIKYVNEAMAWASAEMVKALIRAHDSKENPTWIGLSDCQEQKMWIWSDGSKFNYTKWNPDEPNFSKGECCVHINFGETKDWNDIPCTLKHPFVCVKKLA